MNSIKEVKTITKQLVTPQLNLVTILIRANEATHIVRSTSFIKNVRNSLDYNNYKLTTYEYAV